MPNHNLGYGTNGYTFIAKGGSTLPQLEAPTFFDDIFGIKDNADSTKIARFQVSGISTNTTRTYTLPNYDGTLATLAGTETLTNKTLTSPAINTAIYPASDDGAALGGAALKWSDLFLAGGAVLNFNNGNFTITHSPGLLTANGNIAVADEAYGVGWNGSAQIPTKNAIYDKIESMGGGAVSPLTLTANNATEVPFTAKGAASQTGNLSEWRDSSNALKLRIGADFNIYSADNRPFEICGSQSSAKIRMGGGGVELYSGGGSYTFAQGYHGAITHGANDDGGGANFLLNATLYASSHTNRTNHGITLNIDRTTGSPSSTATFLRLQDDGNDKFQFFQQGFLGIYNGTVPSASVTNGVLLYSEDVSSSAELKVRDEAGNITTLSPHNFSKIPTTPEEMAWAYYSEKEGKYINVDMLKVVRMLEKISGEQLVFSGKLGD